MQDLFDGYLPTKDKSPLVKFAKKENLISLKDAKKLDEYAGRLAKGVILIDVDNYEESEILMNIIEDLQINCRVVETTRGKHFYFCGGNIERGGTHLKLAVGVEADIKVGGRNSISVIKYKGQEREIIYDIEPDEQYDPVPEWLRPIAGRWDVDFVGMGDGDGRNDEFYRYILVLQRTGIANDDIEKTIRLINKYVLSVPLSEDELKKILRPESFRKASFYDSKGFRHELMGRYLINNCHVIILNDQLHIYEDGVYKTGKRYLERKMQELVDTLKINQRREVVAYLDNKAPIIQDQSDAKYIVFANGLYNLETDTIEDYRHDVITTNKIPHDYNPQAYNADMDHTLDRLSCGDGEIRMLLEEIAGYCLYRRNELRKAFILIGDKANGKSTYLDCLTHMVGDDNTAALDIKELGDRFRTSALFGKLINAGDDIGDEFIADASIFKKVVSGDRITAEFKGQQPFEFSNYSKFIFSANSIPRIKDKTGAVLDRLIIVPFNATFTRNDPDYDPYIKYKLRDESAMEYLIQIGIMGLKRVLLNNGFTVCQKVERELEEYAEQNNPIIGFLKECDIEKDIINQPNADVYTAYKVYCNTYNYTPVGPKVLSTWLNKEYGLITKSTRKDGKFTRIYVKEAENGAH